MKSIAILTLCAFLGGCGSYYWVSRVHGIVNGNAIVTPYGPLNGNVVYDNVKCFGNCPQANMEVLNGDSTNAVIINR